MSAAMNNIARTSTWIAGGFLILCSIFIAIEVFIRKVFSVSIGGIDEVTSYIFAIGVAWSLGFTLLSKAHIRIDVIYTHLGQRSRSLLDLLSLLSVLVMGVLLLERALDTTMTSYEIGARSNTPLGVILWAPQALWVSGIGFFVLIVLTLLVKVVRTLRLGDFRSASAVAGIRTIDEEIRDET